MATRLENIATILVLLMGIIPIATQFYTQGDATSLIILSAILLIVIIYFIADYVKDKFGQIDKILERMRKLEEKVDYMRDIHNLDKRISLVEQEQKKTKKGQIDPRIIIVVILLILLYFYLRSIGFIR